MPDRLFPYTPAVGRRNARMNAKPLKIIYIAGAGRSGSTLLSNILGQLPGAVTVGELYYLWERGMRENILCGCGASFRDCPFWRDVLNRAQAALGSDDVGRLLESGIHGARTRHIPFLLTAAGRQRFAAASRPFIRLLCHIYTAVQEKTGCDCLIDASKFPTYGFLLTQIPHVEVSIVHLIRDPRAVGFSWQRHKFNPDSGRLFGQMSTGRSAAIWNTWNIGAEILGRTLHNPDRYLRLRYESFIDQPRESLERIIQVAGLDVDPTSVVRDHTVAMKHGHTIAGNPVRFHNSMQLRPDVEWKTAMPVGKRTLTIAMTWPLLRRYGYSSG
jgi:hypothetical protein